MYFEDKEIKEVAEAPTGWVGLTYAEGAVPQNEVMHKDEYEAGKSDVPSNDRQAIFVKSSQDIQRKMLDALIEHNVRYNEVGMLLDWINEAMSKTRDKVLNACYGTKDWQTEATVDQLPTPDLEEGQPTDALAVFLLLKERKTGLRDFGRVLQAVSNMSVKAQTMKLEEELGRPVNSWRLDDLSAYVELKDYDKSPEDTQGVQSDGGNEGGTVEGVGTDAPEGDGPAPSAQG